MENIAKSKLRNGEDIRVFNVFESLKPSVAKIISQSGYDLALIETEHILHNPENITSFLLLCLDNGLSTATTITSVNRSVIGTYMDAGSQGICLSHAETTDQVEELAKTIGPYAPDRLIGIESRGFIVAAPLAIRLGIGFTMIRKQNKLPGETTSFTYELEYGSDTIEIQTDAITPGQTVVVVDDLLATGGTAAASIALLRELGADIAAAAFIIELNSLGGRARFDTPVHSLIGYDD